MQFINCVRFLVYVIYIRFWAQLSRATVAFICRQSSVPHYAALRYATLNVCVYLRRLVRTALFPRVKKRVGLIQKATRLNTGMTCAKKFKAKSGYTLAAYDDVTELQQRHYMYTCKSITEI